MYMYFCRVKKRGAKREGEEDWDGEKEKERERNGKKERKERVKGDFKKVLSIEQPRCVIRTQNKP